MKLPSIARAFAALLCGATLLCGSALAQAPAGRITAHVLDVYSGTPANGIKVELFMEDGAAYKLIKSAVTNVDGRPPEGPMVTPENMKNGKYRMVVHVGDYYKKIGAKLPEGYYTRLTVDFDVYDAKQPHHVPFQITPWTQSTSVLPG
jgi:hydroxyisourate hydrolase